MGEDAKMCSKCKKNPVAYPDSKNPWCKECRAEAQKAYLETKEGMAEGKGFALGVAACRAEWSEHFEHQRSGSFSGYEICDLIRQAPAPQRVD